MKNTKEEVFTLDFSDIKRDIPVGSDAFNANKTDYGRFGKNELYYKDGDPKITWKGTTATVAGELNWVGENERNGYTKLTKDGNYFAFSLIDWFKDKEITVDNGGKVKKSKETDWICSVDSGKKPITVKYNDDVIAVFDLSSATIDPKTP